MLFPRVAQLATATCAATALLAVGGAGLATPSASAGPAPGAVKFQPSLSYVECPSLTGGDVTLPPGTRCAKLTVPLDWQTPDDGRTVDIAVTVTPAKKRPGRQGLTWNPGGPGAGSIKSFHADWYSKIPKSVKDRFDWVSWDPRGVGLSEPKLDGCRAVTGVFPPATGPVDWDAFWGEVAQVQGAANAACFDANPNSFPYIGTWQVIRDLEALRSALGYKTWNYWGMSYGTVIGNAYARAFPGKLRTLIQDGSVMADYSITRSGATISAGYHTMANVYASVTKKDQGEKIKTIAEYLNDHVLSQGPSGSQTTYTRWNFGYDLVNGLMTQEDYVQRMKDIDFLYSAIQSAKGGKNDPSKVAAAVARLAQSVPEDDELSLQYAINCADMHDRPTASDLARMSEAAEAAYGTMFGIGANDAAQCFGLPANYSPTASDDYSLIELKTPPLFLLTTGDAATPWVGGRSLANTFIGSRVVTYNSTEHVSFFRTPSRCVKSTAENYLLKLKLPKKDKFCQYVQVRSAE